MTYVQIEGLIEITVKLLSHNDHISNIQFDLQLGNERFDLFVYGVMLGRDLPLVESGACSCWKGKDALIKEALLARKSHANDLTTESAICMEGT